ncbi:hypothetical protein [Rhodosalinus halophilus]|nr:hypothetical protein [Rhodosalinus halophilus]
MRYLVVLTAALAMAATAPPAGAFTAVNRLDVNPLPQAGAFEVIQSRGAGPRQFWCAAADYARRELGAPASQRIVLARPRHPAATAPGRTAVTFRMAPRGARPESRGGVSTTVRIPGEAYSTFFARGFCEDGKSDRFDRPWLSP